MDKVDRVLWPLADEEFGEVVWSIGGWQKGVPMAVLGSYEMIWSYMKAHREMIFFLGPKDLFEKYGTNGVWWTH